MLILPYNGGFYCELINYLQGGQEQGLEWGIVVVVEGVDRGGPRFIKGGRA